MERTILFFLIMCFVKTDAVRMCFMCSYTLSADPSFDYECVIQQNINTSLTIANCESCYTKASYGTDLRVRSVARGCLATSICTGDLCCDRNGPYITCEHKCNNDTCNRLNVENWPHVSTNTGVTNLRPRPWTMLAIGIASLTFCFI